MSHYTVGTGASAKLRRYAILADRERSAAFSRALRLLVRVLLPRRAAKSPRPEA